MMTKLNKRRTVVIKMKLFTEYTHAQINARRQQGTDGLDQVLQHVQLGYHIESHPPWPNLQYDFIIIVLCCCLL